MALCRLREISEAKPKRRSQPTASIVFVAS